MCFAHITNSFNLKPIKPIKIYICNEIHYKQEHSIHINSNNN